MIIEKENVQALVTAVLDDLRNCLFTTLGPYGTNVLLHSNDGQTKFTKDGISILQSLHYEDVHKQAVLNIIKDSSLATYKNAGDGTTSTAVLTSGLYNYLKNETKPSNVMASRLIQDELLDKFYSFLEEHTNPVNEEDLKAVANTAANYNKALANLAYEAISQRGKYGSISLAKAPHLKNSSITVRTGYIFERGYLNSLLVTHLEDQAHRSTKVGWAIVVDGKIENFTPLMDLYKRCLDNKVNFYIIARDFAPAVLATILQNYKLNKNIVPILISGFMDEGSKALEDLALYIDTEVIPVAMISEYTGQLGVVDYLEIDNTTTIIRNTAAPLEAIQQRVEFLKRSMENRAPLVVKQIKTRLSQLNGINILVEAGGETEAQVEENFDILDDAIKSVECAYDYGVVPGGGFVYRQEAVPESVADFFLQVLQQDTEDDFSVVTAKDARKTVEEVYVNALSAAIALYNVTAIIS